MIMITSIRIDSVSELLPPTSLFLIPRCYMSVESHVGMMTSTGKKSWLVYQSSVAILPAKTYGSKQEEWAKRMRIFLWEAFLFILDRNF
jgi:hypothetical protein